MFVGWCAPATKYLRDLHTHSYGLQLCDAMIGEPLMIHWIVSRERLSGSDA